VISIKNAWFNPACRSSADFSIYPTTISQLAKKSGGTPVPFSPEHGVIQGHCLTAALLRDIADRQWLWADPSQRNVPKTKKPSDTAGTMHSLQNK
jgi:hypothetical protein